MTGHTPSDEHVLRHFGVDPSTVQPREHAVACMRCGEKTWNLAGLCHVHYEAPGVVRRKAATS